MAESIGAVADTVNTALRYVIRRLIHTAVIWSIKNIKSLVTTETQGPSMCIDTDIPALHPPALLVTDVCHIVQVTPDVAIREITVPTSNDCGGVDEDNQKLL